MARNTATTMLDALTLIVSLHGQDPGATTTTLGPGSKVNGAVASTSPVVGTDAIQRLAAERSSADPCRGCTHKLRVDEDGVYRIELRAALFDAYLVLRDDHGDLVAEDNDGLLVTHARIVADLEGGRTYTVEACALFGRTGDYRLEVAAGAPAAPNPLVRQMQAIREARSMLDERDEKLPPNHHLIALACDTLGTYYWQIGNYKAALPLMERALAIHGHNHQGANTLVAFAHVQVGAQLEGLGRDAVARTHYETAIAMIESLEQPHVPHLCLALNNLALLEQKAGDLATAEHLLRRMLEVSEQELGAEHRETALALNNLGRLLLDTPRLDEAEALLRRALAIRRAKLGKEDPTTAFTLNNLGIVATRRGRPHEAAVRFREVLRIRSAALPDPHPGTVEALTNLAQALQATGNYTEAEPLLRRAVRAAPQVFPPGSAELVQIQLGFSSLLEQQGRFDEAVDVARRATTALDRSGRVPDALLVGGLHTLASALFRQQEARHQPPDDECLRLFERAKTICEAAPKGQMADYVVILNNYSAALVARHRVDEAEAALRRSLALRIEAVGEQGLQTAWARNNLANLLHLQGRHAEAEPLARDALAIVEAALGPSHPLVVEGRVNLAHILQETGRLDEASRLTRASAADNVLLLAQFAASSDEVGALHHTEQLRQGVEAFVAMSVLRGEADGLDEALTRLVQWQGQTFRVGRDVRQRLAAVAAEHHAEMEEFRQLQQQIARAVAPNAQPAPDITELVERRRHLEAELVRAMQGVGPTVTSAQIAAALPPGSVFVDFQVRADHVVGRIVDGKYQLLSESKVPLLSAWVLRSGDAHAVHVDLGRVPPIAQAVAAHRRRLAVDGGRGVVDPTQPGRDPDQSSEAPADLHRLLWRPIQAAVGGATRVWIFASGFLGRLPFETIADGRGRFLLDDHDFVYLDDPAAIVPTPTVATAAPSLLALGGVDYGLPAEPTAASPWQALPATAKEAADVAAMWRIALPQATVDQLDGTTATEGELRRRLPGRTTLHLATHAQFDSAAGNAQLPGLQASLVCAGANAAPVAGDGLLTAEEVAWLDLRGTELVVLSACETSLGPEMAASVMSLRRAFHMAGARHVVSSMWRVDDRATAELMRTFYECHLRDGLDPAASLRQARLTLRERDRKAGNGAERPGIWGAWVCSTVR